MPYKGSITYKGQDLHSVEADKIVGLGIAQVPEGRGIFGNLTVMENLKLATWVRKDKAEIAKDYDRVFDIFPRLKERVAQLGGTLSGGEQQMLAVGRALMSRGKMMLLDEPSMGLSPVLVREIFRVLKEIIPPARPSCWSNRMRIWRSGWQGGDMCLKPEPSHSPGLARISWWIPGCGKLISADNFSIYEDSDDQR